jgi:hypothetical protein
MQVLVSRFVRILSAAGVITMAPTCRSDLVISFADAPVVINFDETLAGVNQNRFLGEGFATSPTFGQLDSDSWEVDAGSGIMPFGGSAGPPPTLFAGGDPQGPVAVAGLFSANTSGINRALGIQPHNDHFTPGTVTLRVLNNTGNGISTWNIAYELFAFNDTSRSTSIGFSYAVGTTTPGPFTPIGALDFTSTLIADSVWTSAIPRSTDLPVSVAAGEHLFLRWTFNTSSQDGAAVSHDEIALDSISVSAVTAVPEPSAVLFALVVILTITISIAFTRTVKLGMRSASAGSQ